MQTWPDLFPLAVLAGGLYMGRLKNLRDGQGCPKCETQAVVAFALAAWAGWELWQKHGEQ